MEDNTLSVDALITQFVDYVKEHGYPKSIHKFCKATKTNEGSFYKIGGSFTRLEKLFWTQQFQLTLSAIEREEIYDSYSAREKMLAFFFTFIENLTENRSFILICHDHYRHGLDAYKSLSLLKVEFEQYVDQLIAEGIANDEIESRKFIDDHYNKGIWVEMLFVLNFWIKDDSPSFEETDAAIEKSVNLGFTMMGKGVLDSMIDFGRFLMKKVR